MKKRILAMVMAVVMAVSLLPVSAFAAWNGTATTKAQQIVNSYFEADDEQKVVSAETTEQATKSTTGGKVSVSKTIAPTDTENEFDVTLKVKTKQNIQNVPQSADAAIVLVLDRSTSMTCCMECGNYKDNGVHNGKDITGACSEAGCTCTEYQGYPKCSTCNHSYDVHNKVITQAHSFNDNNERRDVAETKAKAFLAQLKKDAVTGDHRYVSIVSFANGSEIKCNWVDIMTESGYTAAESAITSTFRQTQNGTDMEAGFKAAKNQLIMNEASIDNNKVDIAEIPNRYAVLLTDGKPTPYGSMNTTSDFCKKVADAADSLRNVATLYSICFAAASDKCYDRNGQNEVSVIEFLDSISDADYPADDADQLQTAFAGISQLIKLMTEAWEVKDPMGANMIFVSKNHAAASYSDGVLTWNLKADTTVTTESGTTEGETVYVYTLTYRVKLNTLADGFVAGQEYATNGYTYLTYVFYNEKNELVDENGNLTRLTSPYVISFNVPIVKGYADDLSFKKVGSNTGDAGLAGATFQVKHADTCPCGAGESDVKESATSAAVTGAVQINGIPSGHAYVLVETNAPTNYIKADDIEFTVSYGDVYVNGEKAQSNWTVVNKYNPPAPTTGTLVVTKTVIGLESLPANFEIAVTKDGETVQNLAVSGATKEENVYTWTLSDVAPGTYSVTESNYIVNGYTVDVIRNVSKVEVAAGETETLALTNTYTAAPATLSSDKLNVSKVLSGREWTEGDSFTFTLTGPDGAPKPTFESITIDATDGSKTKSFGEITFTEVGTYTYTVQEHPGNIPGVIYDPSVYTVTVEVSAKADGALEATATYQKGKEQADSMIFTNTYGASSVTVPSSDLQVSKVLSGREWAEGDFFTFTLSGSTGAPMPAEGGNTVTLTKENQKGAFGSITFDKVGVYNYTVTEGETSIAGVTKDSTVYHVIVTVTDNKAGKLEADVAYKIADNDAYISYGANDGMKFTNTYSASGTLYGDDKFDGETKTADGQLKVSKTLSGRDWAEGETFTINLTGSEGAPMPAEGGKTVTLTKEKQNGAFGNIEYDEGDIGKTYTYTVTETPGSATGVTYDATQYTVTVKVSVNAGDASKLDVTAVHTSSADANKEPPEYSYATAGNMPFTNTYKAGSVIVPGDDGEGVEGKLEINKSFSGRDWADGDVFTFTIAAVTEGAPLPASTSVTIGKPASGSENTAAFGGITFDKADEYKYTVSETKGTLSNVTYDTVVYTVIINVTDDGTGKLKYDVAYSSSKGDFDYAAKDGMVFANTYTKPSKPSTDIPDNPPALNNVDHYAYIIGYPDGNVKPAGNITRAEVATIFFRLLTDDSRSLFWSTENAYSDVSADQWFNNAISTLSNAGIINGYEDGTFRPNAPITRAEFAKIAASFFTYAEKEYQGLYPDVPETKWYALFVEAASELGLITGYPDGTFRPDQLITRAEACTIVNRTIERKPHEDQLHQDMILWPDNPAPGEVGHEWYYEQVQEATNSHEYEMKNEFENWTEILENRDWAALEQEWSDANSAPGPDVMK